MLRSGGWTAGAVREDEYALAGYVDVFEHLRTRLGKPRVRQGVRASDAESVAQAAKPLGDCLDALRELGAAAEGAAEAIPADADADALSRRATLSSMADLCFVAQRELKPLGARLGHTDETGATLSTVETVYRKLRRICARVLETLCPLVGRSVDLTNEQQEIVEGSIAVRRVFTRFRRSLVTTLTDDASVTAALDAAVTSINQLLAQVDHADIRVPDVLLITGLQERIASWFRAGSPLEAGRRIHADLLATADLLRMVNQRQELRVHDAEVIETALSLVGGGVALSETLLMMLGPLDGMDDELDTLRAHLARAPSDEALGAIEARLAELRARQEGQNI